MAAIEDQARSIFLAALERPADQWSGLLDEACGDNADLRARADQLLDAHRALGSIHGGGPRDATVDDPPAAERPGAAVGPYKLLEPIGGGGVGVGALKPPGADRGGRVRRRVHGRAAPAGPPQGRPETDQAGDGHP